MSTVSISFSALARETAFAICNVKQKPSEFLCAVSLVEKLKGGSTEEKKKIHDPVRGEIEYSLQKDFPDNELIELTYGEKDLLVNALKAIKEWHPKEASIVAEFQEKLQIKLV